MKKNKNYIKKIIFIISIIFIIAFILNIYMNVEIDNYSNASQGENQVNQIHNISKQNTESIESIIENVSKSIVGISKLQNNGITVFLEGGAKSLELGTGIIVSDNGYILTNQHICGNKYSKCYITLYDGREFKANVLWADEDIDLAVLKIPASKLNYVALGDSNKIRVGESVYAIGNPVGFEFQRTVTSGIISGLDRTIKIENDKEQSYMEGLIQTDAAINEGNSGGPLINKRGEVIGINSIKITTAEGIGFAVPINMVKTIFYNIVENGDFEQANLGILAYDKEVIPYTDIRLKFNKGVYVVQVTYNGPAYKAGVREKDIITHIDGKEIEKIGDLREVLYTKRAGNEISLEVKRKNKTKTIKVILGKKY